MTCRGHVAQLGRIIQEPKSHAAGSFGLNNVLFIQRSATVLIDKNGTIRYISRATNPHASFDKDELLKPISSLWEDVEPTPGFEPGTFALPRRCSTT